MSKKFVINGTKPLYGTIDVLGSKNASLPIIAATLLTKEQCRIHNLPRVSDVYLMLDVLKNMGSKISWLGARTVAIENKTINPLNLSGDIVKKMRASILFLGPLLARFKKIEYMRYPGGCTIGPRPIDVHLKAFEDLGAEVLRHRNFFSVKFKDALKPASALVLEEFSVTATENILMFLSSVPHATEIKIAACEPHVHSLAKFLSAMGAKITGAGTSNIKVRGAQRLKGAGQRIIPDYIEAGTFILMALIVGGEVTVRNVPISNLDLMLKKLAVAGANINVDTKRDVLTIRSKSGGFSYDNKKLVCDRIQTMPYPGIPTDLQSVFSVFASQTHGETFIHEPLYEKRLDCLSELTKMGADVKILDPHRAIIRGPTRLCGAQVIGQDLRSGAALVIAGLAAKGTTVVSGAEHIERGYEDLDERLRKLGADVIKISS